MKVCAKCGAHNSDERSFCVDCNEKLGDKLSTLEEQQMRNNVNKKIEEMYNSKNPLYVSVFDKIIGVVSLIGLLCSLVLVVINKVTERSFEFLWIGVIFFLLASIEAFVPKLTWTESSVQP